MTFDMLGTINDSSYNHLVQNISASRDVQRNCNTLVTPLLGLGARLTHLPLHKHSSNLHRDFIFSSTITISIFPRLYVPLTLLLQCQVEVEVVVAVVVVTVVATRVVDEVEVEAEATA